MKRDKEEFKAKNKEAGYSARQARGKSAGKAAPFPVKEKPDVSGAAGTRGTCYRNSRNAGHGGFGNGFYRAGIFNGHPAGAVG